MDSDPATAGRRPCSLHMLRLAFAATVVVSCVLTTLPLGTPAEARHGHCDIKGRVVAKSMLVIAYVSGKRREGSRSGALAVCRRSTGRRAVLARNNQDEFWFDRPAHAVAVRGSTVGYAETEFEDGISPTPRTFVLVQSLAKPTRNRPLAPVYDPVAKIGSLDVTPGGAAAWIECPEPDPDNVNGNPYPNCVAPGRSINRVVIAPVGSRPSQVSQGSGVDPVSLRIKNGVATWIQAGQRRAQAIVSGT